MSIIKEYRLSIVGYILSAICFISYNIIGVKIASDGTLIEAFAFSAIGSILLLLSTGFLIIKTIKLLFFKRR